jgi:hypothetical protein
MANEGERSTSADKGKGKVDDVRELNGKKPHTDEKTTAEGKKKDEEPQEGRSRRSSRQVLAGAEHTPPVIGQRIQKLTGLIFTEELSEEDQQLKNELEMLVERLKVGSSCPQPVAAGNSDVNARFFTNNRNRTLRFMGPPWMRSRTSSRPRRPP